MNNEQARELARLWHDDHRIATLRPIHKPMLPGRWLEPDSTGGYRIGPVGVSALGAYLINLHTSKTRRLDDAEQPWSGGDA